MNKERGLPKANMVVKQRIVHYKTKECQTSIHVQLHTKQYDMLDGIFVKQGCILKSD